MDDGLIRAFLKFGHSAARVLGGPKAFVEDADHRQADNCWATFGRRILNAPD